MNIVLRIDCYNCKVSVLNYNTLHNMLYLSQLHCLSFLHARTSLHNSTRSYHGAVRYPEFHLHV